jgi:hypothetical protein
MGFIFSVTAGLVVWIVLWALGVKSFDAFLLTTLIVLLAAGTRIVTPFLPGNQRS